MATNTADLVEQLGKMTVLELVELKNRLEEEWGVTAAAPVAVAAPGAVPAAGDGAAAEEKTSFDVVLQGAGDRDGSSRRDAPLLLQPVLQLDELEHGHLAELLDERGGVGSHR